MTANKALERTVEHRGPSLGGHEMVRPAPAMAAWPAAQLGR